MGWKSCYSLHHWSPADLHSRQLENKMVEDFRPLTLVLTELGLHRLPRDLQWRTNLYYDDSSSGHSPRVSKPFRPSSISAPSGTFWKSLRNTPAPTRNLSSPCQGTPIRSVLPTTSVTITGKRLLKLSAQVSWQNLIINFWPLGPHSIIWNQLLWHWSG